MKKIHAGFKTFLVNALHTKDLIFSNSYYLGVSAFLDLLFLFVFGIVFGILSSKILEYAYALGISLDASALTITQAIDFSFLSKIFLLMFLLLSFLFMLWNVIQSPNFRLAKMIADNQKIDKKKYLVGFSKINVITFLLFGLWWIISYFYDFVKEKSSGSGLYWFLLILMVISMIFLLFFTILSYYHADEKKPIKKALNSSKKDRLFLFFSFLAVVGLFLIFDFISSLMVFGISFFIPLPQVLNLMGIIISAVILLPLLAYIRIFMFMLIKVTGGKSK